MNAIKTAVLTTGSASLGLISYLAQMQQLAGVLIFGQWDQEKALMAHQLGQSGIATQYCPEGDIDTPITALSGWGCQLAVVFCCRTKIPLSVANTPTYGAVNLHASSLPNYRGADPIYWQIRNGEQQFQFTAHRLSEAFDTGTIVAQVPVTIAPYDTAARVFSNLNQQLPTLLDMIFEQLNLHGQLQEQPQQGVALHTAPRVTEQDLTIHWNHSSAEQIHNQVRAGNPQNGGARLNMGNGQVQLLQATPSALPNYGALPGTIIHLSPQEGLVIALKEESIRLDIIVNNDGVLDGYLFAKSCNLTAGMQFS